MCHSYTPWKHVSREYRNGALVENGLKKTVKLEVLDLSPSVTPSDWLLSFVTLDWLPSIELLRKKKKGCSNIWHNFDSKTVSKYQNDNLTKD